MHIIYNPHMEQADRSNVSLEILRKVHFTVSTNNTFVVIKNL